MTERSLVLLKPDAVQRGIVGEILHRFERRGLKIVGLKMIHPDTDFAKNHYEMSDEKLKEMGGHTVSDCKKYGLDMIELFGTDDAKKIGKLIWNWNAKFLSSSPLVAAVIEGHNSISSIRKMVGHLLPALSEPGTIRGDFGLDTVVGANSAKRSIYNLVHASGDKEEAEFEIGLWFSEDELLEYKRVHEDLYTYQD